MALLGLLKIRKGDRNLCLLWLFPAYLVEVRGDWAMRKEVFNFPGWRDKKRMLSLVQMQA